MPMPDKPAPDAQRVRDNQRRARSRRKELLQDMRHKLQEYEHAGAQATLGMQQAARRVALENERLRLLLHRHGVTSEETQAFLRSFGDDGDAARQHSPKIQKTALPPLSPPRRDPPKAQSQEHDTSFTQSPSEMHCDAAAQLLAEMNGHDDREAMKSALGCEGGHACNVKNTALFRIMEDRDQALG